MVPFKVPRGELIFVGICIAAFFVNHLFSFRFNRRRSGTKKPNIGTVMVCPYARVLPIHLTIILGTGVAVGPHALILFLWLKTAADLVMHAIEHAAPEAMI